MVGSMYCQIFVFPINLVRFCVFFDKGVNHIKMKFCIMIIDYITHIIMQFTQHLISTS
jgi:hypothetical protein